MLWISKTSPIYVWDLDRWFNETNKITYWANINKLQWEAFAIKSIPFPKKTLIKYSYGWEKVK